MADSVQVVIGLEVHVQLQTVTKLFCGCKTTFGAPANSQTCPVCLGLPGSLPVMNRQAFDLALRAGLALGSKIAPFTKWDRKNYYYPDLPKNYQISQYDLPFAEGGGVSIDTPAGPKFIRLIRVHLEEDAGKNLHSAGGDSLVDLNRTGTPLLEIVSEPDLSAPAEAKAYLELLRAKLRDLEVSDCEMQEGSLRCDANINLHLTRAGQLYKTPIVEIKNLNSIKAVERALEYEIERQQEQFAQTGQVLGQAPKSTRGWDDDRGMTLPQREKEEAADYRYFPDPDLAPVVVDAAWLDRVRQTIGESSDDRRQRYQTQLQLSSYDANVLVDKGPGVYRYFEDLLVEGIDAKAACNWLINDLVGLSPPRIKQKNDLATPAPALAGLIRLVKSNKINLNDAREKVLPAMIATGTSAADLAQQMGLEVVQDVGAIKAVCQEALTEMAKAAADFRAGNAKALGAIVGLVMKKSKGKFPPAVVNQTLMDLLHDG